MLDGDHKALVDAALPVCARYGLAVAGGYAVKAHGLVQRPSEDIDFATETATPMEEIVAALAAAYRTVGTPRQSIKIAAFGLSLRAASLTAPAARQQATTAESRACGSTICVRGTAQR